MGVSARMTWPVSVSTSTIASSLLTSVTVSVVVSVAVGAGLVVAGAFDGAALGVGVVVAGFESADDAIHPDVPFPSAIA